MTSTKHRYELLTPCTCGEDCGSFDVTSVVIEPADHADFLGAVQVWRVRFDEDEIWTREIVQYDENERTAVTHAVQRVFGENVFKHGAKLI